MWSHINSLTDNANKSTNIEIYTFTYSSLILQHVSAFLDHSHGALYTFIPSACAECDDSLPFSGASSIPLCYIPFPSTLFHQLFFHPPSLHLAIYFLVYVSALLFPNSYIIFFWEFHFFPFSVHAQTNVIYLNLLSVLQWVFKPLYKFLYWLISSNFLFHCCILGLKFFYTCWALHKAQLNCQLHSIQFQIQPFNYPNKLIPKQYPEDHNPLFGSVYDFQVQHATEPVFPTQFQYHLSSQNIHLPFSCYLS